MPFFSIAGSVPKVAAADVRRLNEEEFRLFYERTAQPLRRYLLRMLNDPATSDDLLQESYLRLLRARLPELASEEHLKNYLFRIGTNLVKDHRSRRLETPFFEDASVATDRPADGDVTRLLATLKPAQRELLWLAYVEKFNHVEIAGILSLKPQSIRPLLSRARAALAEALRRGGFGETK